MATIESYDTQDGRRYMVRYRKPNRRQTMKRGFRTKRDAERFASEVEVSKDRGQYIDPRDARVTIGELGPGWLSRQTHLKPSSYRPLEIAWRVHVEPAWAEHRLSEVTHTEVQSWVSKLGETRGATTVKRAYGVLSSILDDAVRDRRLLANPASDVKTPRKVRKARTYLTHDQVHELAREAKGAGPVVLMLAYTGLRWGELVGLRVRDVDRKRRRLNVTQNAVEVGQEIVVGTPKSHESRSVPYLPMLDDVLEDACRSKLPDALVFPAPDGGFMRRPRTSEDSGSWFGGAVRRSGVPRLTPHDLRHTAASLAISSGAHVKAVQRMLGHASAAMTLDTYADLFDDDLDAVAAAMNVGALAAARRAHRPPDTA
jgi:integrase